VEHNRQHSQKLNALSHLLALERKIKINTASTYNYKILDDGL
jgi:hypothetical protein